MIKHIQAGKLTLQFSQGQERFDDLIGLASRENQKRGFLFVSKVLGKHIPVKPSVMRQVYNELATLCHLKNDSNKENTYTNNIAANVSVNSAKAETVSSNSSETIAQANNVYVIGMAETATGLGAGVADSMARLNPTLNVFYQHTTRHILKDHEQWFTLCESHSHAVDHILYRPNQFAYDGINQSQYLVLVDDEMTTGKTLLQLARGVLEKIPSIKKVIIVTLVSWLNDDAQKAFSDLAVDVEFVQIIKGQFEFESDPTFNARYLEVLIVGSAKKSHEMI